MVMITYYSIVFNIFLLRFYEVVVIKFLIFKKKKRPPHIERWWSCGYSPIGIYLFSSSLFSGSFGNAIVNIPFLKFALISSSFTLSPA